MLVPGRSRRGHTQRLQSDTNRLLDIQHSLLPSTLPAWREGLLKVNADKSRCHSSVQPENAGLNGYLFPRPDLFIAIENDEKRHCCIEAWLKLRTPLIARLTLPSYLPPTLLHQDWRALLTLGYVFETDKSDTKCSKRREKVLHLMQGCCGEFELRELITEQRPNWRGKPYSSHDVEQLQEILWELSELGFRFEFFTLDRRASSIPRDNIVHQRDLGGCFPDGENHPGTIDIGSANHGLAHSFWMDRAPYVFSSRKVMQSWMGEVPAFVSTTKSTGYSEEDFLLLERQIVGHYADTFFQYFGRSPVLPRCLAHTPCDDYEPELRKRIESRRAGVYLDVSAWEHTQL